MRIDGSGDFIFTRFDEKHDGFRKRSFEKPLCAPFAFFERTKKDNAHLRKSLKRNFHATTFSCELQLGLSCLVVGTNKNLQLFGEAHLGVSQNRFANLRYSAPCGAKIVDRICSLNLRFLKFRATQFRK